LTLVQVLVVRVIFIVICENGESGEEKKQKQPHKSFHENPAERRV